MADQSIAINIYDEIGNRYESKLTNGILRVKINNCDYYAIITKETIKQRPKYILIDHIVEFFIDNLPDSKILIDDESDNSEDYQIIWRSSGEIYFMSVMLFKQL